MSEKIEFETIGGYSGRFDGQYLYVPLGIEVNGQRFHVTLTPIEPELKPCPLCGGGMGDIKYQFSDFWNTICSNCGCSISIIANNQTNAINNLNKRAPRFNREEEE